MDAVIGFPKREVQAISLIGLAHMLSHLYWIAFAPIAPAMMGTFQISALEWGLSLGVFSVTTGLFQTPMGLVVERVGGRRGQGASLQRGPRECAWVPHGAGGGGPRGARSAA